MTQYAKFNGVLKLDPFATYPQSNDHQVSWSSTPAAGFINQLFIATTTAKTYELGTFSTVVDVIVENTDTTNYVEVEWYEQRGTQAAGDLAFADANPDTIADNNTNGTFATNGAETGGYVRVASSENSGENDGVFLISEVVDGDNLTLGAAEALTANTNDTTATLSFERRNKARVPAGRALVICRAAVGSDLVIQADTASCNLQISVLGT